MNALTLPADLEAWAQAEVAAGYAQSLDELVTKALDRRREELSWVRARIQEAEADIAAGRVIDGDEFLAELDGWISEDAAAADAEDHAALVT